MTSISIPLGDICSLITDGKHGDCKNEEDSGFFFISAKDIKDSRIHYENARQIVYEDFLETHRRTNLQPGDILLTNSGTIGRLAIAPDEEITYKTTFQKSVAILKPILELINSKYLYYFLLNKQTHLENAARGAAQKNLLLSELRRFNIQVPSKVVQNSIVSILSPYDDLIENNRRRIQLLEEAARLLYQEWFVRLRFPGHEHTKIVDGVPEGWIQGGISDFYDTTSGGTPSRKNPDYYTGDINWVKTQELVGGYIFETSEKITQIAISQSAAKILPKRTLLVAMYGATIGEIGILAEPAACNQACCAIIPKKDLSNEIFAYLFFKDNKMRLKSLSQGAAQNNVNQQVIREYPMILPSKNVMFQFITYVNPIMNAVKNLSLTNTNLIKARDLLLPRLMNGVIPV